MLVGFFYVYIFKSDSSTEKEIKRIPLYDAEVRYPSCLLLRLLLSVHISCSCSARLRSGYTH